MGRAYSPLFGRHFGLMAYYASGFFFVIFSVDCSCTERQTVLPAILEEGRFVAFPLDASLMNGG